LFCFARYTWGPRNRTFFSKKSLRQKRNRTEGKGEAVIAVGKKL